MVLLQLVAVLGMATLGACAGWRIGKSKWWSVGYLLPLAIVTLVILGRRSVAASFVQPVEWVTRTSVIYLLMSAAVPALLATLMPRLRTRGQRVAITVLMSVMVIYYGLLPVILPWWVRPSLAAIPTRMDPHGVCLQAHEYTCGPAAAVSALQRLGIHAEEGPLGIAAFTAPAEGTDARDLASAIEHLYAHDGARAAYQRYRSPDEARRHLPVIVSVTWDLVTHHYITILAISDDTVLAADPLSGQRTLSRQELDALWPGAAVQVWREGE